MSIAALRRFRQASELLARRWRGEVAPSPDWLCRDAVRALSLPLCAGADVVMAVVLKDGISPRELPSKFDGLPLRVLRAPKLQAQRRPPLLTLHRTTENGTTTALVRDRLNGERHYLLTCGHVVAPDSAARFGDAVRVGIPGADPLDAYLREWQPAIGPGNAPSTLDAALIEIDAAALQVLRGLDPVWLPRGLSDATTADLPVALQRVDGPMDGRLCAHWSGEVGAGGADLSDYFLQDAIGYATSSPTQGGDSGGAIWTAGDALLGMHIGAVESGPGGQGANAVMARVKPALDWYSVKPFTRDDPATLGPEDWPAMPDDGRGPAPAVATPEPATPASADQDTVTLAKTLWGEARGEDKPGMEAVAAVIINRLNSRYRGRTSASAVCTDPFQFSCWNTSDPNRAKLARIDSQPDDDFRTALEISQRALAGGLSDPTFGARHYVSTLLPAALRPDWLRDKRPCRVIGHHEFYNDIA